MVADGTNCAGHSWVLVAIYARHSHASRTSRTRHVGQLYPTLLGSDPAVLVLWGDDESTKRDGSNGDHVIDAVGDLDQGNRAENRGDACFANAEQGLASYLDVRASWATKVNFSYSIRGFTQCAYVAQRARQYLAYVA